MAIRKTLDFLPKIFQSDTNRKFLSATLDQLVSEPEYTRLNGYVGRKFAPTYKTTDTYIIENNIDRQNYQLEPSIVIKNQDNIEFYNGYTDLLNKISYYGGIVDNHDRLFTSPYYAYNGLFDLDKFVNFSQYYWLPNGPQEVLIPSAPADTQGNYNITRDTTDNSYKIQGKENQNPELVLIRGGLYKFNVNQPGHKFYIQTEPGISGKNRALPALSSREVYGVRNNGADVGQVEFLVPIKEDQDVYLRMPIMPPVDYVLEQAFTDLNGKSWQDIVSNYGGFDGLDIDPAGRYVIFNSLSDNDIDWQYDSMNVVPAEFRRGIFFVRNENNVVTFEYTKNIPTNYRVYARLGQNYANKEFYHSQDDKLYPVPVLTAQLDTLYYQDSSDPNIFGKIRIINTALDTIDVENNILGKKNYTSSTGVDFSNGLLIRFDDNVTPSKYANGRYVVEGVGKSIRLVNFDNLVFPESGIDVESEPWDLTNFDSELYDESAGGPTLPDYITINRSSLDLNPWSRHNRWFHIDVIVRSAELNGTTAIFNQTIRAKRPIIEFDPDIQLFNFGQIGRRAVTHIDTTVMSAFNEVQHDSKLIIDNYSLRVGQRILFANDRDPLVKTQIYKVQHQIQDEPSYFDYYDETGIGTISIEKPTLTYTTNNVPILITGPGNVYRWTVYSTKSDLTLTTLIEGVSVTDDSAVGTIIDVEPGPNFSYEITFSTLVPIDIFDRKRVKLRGTGGTRIVRGTGTQFIRDIEEGSQLANADGLSLGVVRAVLTNTKLLLEQTSPTNLVNSAYKYKEPKIQLIASEDPDDVLTTGDVIVATDGVNKGKSFWYNGEQWIPAQTKVGRNVTPLFDIFDNSDRSFGSYNNSQFKGNKIFSYKTAAGTLDSVLGFPVYYSTRFGESGSIVSEITFENNYGNESFQYYEGNSVISLRIDKGYIRQNIDRHTFNRKSIWSKVNEQSKQYQIFSRTFDGTTNYFEIDIVPDEVDKASNIKVFLNNVLLTIDKYNLTTVNNVQTVRVNVNLLQIGDKVDILIYNRKQVSELAYYQVPTNLDLNSKNQNLSTLTIGQIRNNLIAIGQNIPGLKGNIPGESNLRDIDYKLYAGNILQNSSPLIYPSLFLINDQTNFVSAIEYAKKEYTKFKNKFLELCLKLPGLDFENPKDGVDKIINNINQVKNKSFSWYYSDMVPYGNADITVYKVLNTRQRLYRINEIFNDRQVQNRAVLVYLNNNQLIKGKDFEFDYDRPGIQLADHLVLSINDVIEIKDYASTDGNFIPETPTKLGLYPKFMPRIYVDNTYRSEYADDAAYFTVTDGISENEFVIKLTDPGKIAHARAQLSGRRTKQHITGIIVKRRADYNPNYSFHYDPSTIDFFEVSMEVCDASFEYTEQNLSDAGGAFLPGKRLCPWASLLVSEITDELYQNGVEVLQGHDGSITPTFNDHRDRFLLELETRIYNNLKINLDQTHIDIRDFLPGKFRSNDYSLSEFNNIIGRQFLKWIGSNKLDYTNNQWFISNDPFTYNYKTSVDSLTQQTIPGYWRAIYRYFYDTDRPHQCPWEMLGITEKPIWWDEEYGPAPYTNGNSILWTDLEQGIIKHGPTAGINLRYARPGLAEIIPVDEMGRLRPPLSNMISGFNSLDASAPFAIGDGGPVESAWQKTSEYPFAIQLAVALMKPAVYFGTYIDLPNYYLNKQIDQYLVDGTKNSIQPTNVTINGEVVNGIVKRTRSYINWIVDYTTSLGINGAAKVRYLLDNCSVQLSYKVAGFTDKKFVSVLAEQYSPSSINDSIIIPDDNYHIHLNKSVPVERVAYSAVIIERTGNGFSVSGYNTNNPFFVIVPSETTGESYTITVDNISAYIYERYRREKIIIPYGTVFKTRQQVVDFLISYQRYLFAQGFVFEEFNQDLQSQQDWVLSSREFLTWTLQGWRAGSIIVLSPVANKLFLLTNNSVVDTITNDISGSRLLDPNFNVIRTNEITVLREDNEFTVTALSGKTIAFAELNLVQYEHVLIFDNETVFRDVIYSPESGSRQYRLKIVGNKTANWNGSLSANGFVYNSGKVQDWLAGKDYKKGDLVSFKNQFYVATQSVPADTKFDINYFRLIEKTAVKTGLLPNFSNHAQRFIDVYDVDSNLLDEQLVNMSNGLIGYRSRDYLTNLNVNPASQVKFYQGFIKDKGTVNSIVSLANTEFNTLRNQVKIYEEWGIRVGEYGATDSNSVVEILIDDHIAKSNPLGIVIVNSNEIVEGLYNITDKDLWNKSDSEQPVRFLNRKGQQTYEADLDTAGYVNIDDIDFPLFRVSNAESIVSDIANIKSGYTIWAANDVNNSWNVYRVSETETLITEMRYGLDLTATITVQNRHDLNLSETIIIKNFNTRLDGLYTVVTIIDDYTFAVRINTEKSLILRTSPVISTGLLFRLDSVRFDRLNQLSKFTPLHGWKNGDLIWVDSDINQRWAVYQKSNPWDYAGLLDNTEGSFRLQNNFGTSIKIRSDQQLVVVGAPTTNSGKGRIHVYSGSSLKEESIIMPEVDLSNIGHSVTVSKDYIFAGAPLSYAGKGAVLVYKNSNITNSTLTQLIKVDSLAPNSQLGFSIAVSDNNQYLYVSSPGANSVHFYSLVELVTRSDVFKLFDAINGVVLPYTITDVDSVAVYIKGTFSVLGADYTIDLVNNKLTVLNDNVPTFAAEGDGGFFAPEDENLTFVAEVQYFNDDVITVVRRSFYKFTNSFAGDYSNENFGHSIAINNDGTSIVVGAPNANFSNPSVIRSGKTYVFANTKTDNPEIKKLQTIDNQDPVYQSRFGTSVELSANSSSLYIGAPGYSDLDYNGGQVYRYLDTGRYHGRILGSVVNPIVTNGHSLIINTRNVVISGTTLAAVVASINAAQIVGVNASIHNNQLLITSKIERAFNKLTIIPGVGTAYTDLGLSVFEYVQTIRKPMNTQTDNFGQCLSLNPSSDLLAVSSTTGTSKTYTVIDDSDTTFDGMSTVFLDISIGTGSVYVYELIPEHIETDQTDGNLVFGDTFIAPSIQFGDLFGSSVAIGKTFMLIGANSNDGFGINSGNVYRYNTTGNRFWQLYRYSNEIVDVAGINSVSLYDKITKAKLATLDFIDPTKNKCLGIAEENLNYKSSTDPAMYNSGSNAIDIDFHWGADQVGQTWWNLDNCKFLDYEQSSLSYRLGNWARLFPGSSIDVYEWIESNVLPSQYANQGLSGTPLYADDSAYVSITGSENSTGIIKSKYYFWVKGITTVDGTSARTLSTVAIENAIRDPKSENLPYAAFLSDRSIALFNCENYFKSNGTILKIDYDTKLNNNIIHSEYQLVQEENKNSSFPERIINKLIDSVSGIDSRNRRVPDPKLSDNRMVGLDIRPRQTVVLNRYAALNNLIVFANQVLAKYPVANKITNYKSESKSYLFASDTVASSNQYDEQVKDLNELQYVNKVAGRRILVLSDKNYNNLWTIYLITNNLQFKLVQNQTYATSQKWYYIPWLAEDYDLTNTVTYTVDFYNQIQQLDIKIGDTVKIRNDSSIGYEIYQFDKDVSNGKLVALEKGTIQFNPILYNIDINNIGYDNNLYETVSYDKDDGQEIRNILNALLSEVFVDDLLEQKNKFIFTLLKYLLSEQPNMDWLFKTSFVGVQHNIKELLPYPNISKDNQDYCYDYISEVKPYKTKIREYRLGYTGLDSVMAGTTDFDLPGYYDKELLRYRSPSGELSKDSELFTQPENINWFNNHLFSVEEITIADAGTGYTTNPQINIISNNDAGEGATAVALINELTGKLLSITVTNPGKNYSNTPIVVINGDGQGARAAARLSNKKIRGIKTILKFDRIGYTTSIKQWLPNTAYSVGQRVSHNGKGYIVRIAHTSDQFSLKNFTVINDSEYTDAVDRVAATYYPGQKQIPREVSTTGNISVSRLIPGTTDDYNIVRTDDEVFNESLYLGPRTGQTLTTPETIDVTGGKFYDVTKSFAPEELVPGTTLDSLTLTINTVIEESKYIYKIVKDSYSGAKYFVVDANKITTLEANLNYNDDKIYLANMSNITLPDVPRRIPGRVIINGEIIQFYHYNMFERYIVDPIRGVDGTGVPLQHPAGTTVIDQGDGLKIPDTTTVSTSTFTYTAAEPKFTTSFSVINDYDLVKNILAVYNSYTKLILDVDYIFEIVNLPGGFKAVITFLAADSFADGLRFNAVYTEDEIWLNRGVTELTDGTGLEGSNHPSAIFIKQFPHNL